VCVRVCLYLWYGHADVARRQGIVRKATTSRTVSMLLLLVRVRVIVIVRVLAR
jgi:hypothetical protein